MMAASIAKIVEESRERFPKMPLKCLWCIIPEGYYTYEVLYPSSLTLTTKKNYGTEERYFDVTTARMEIKRV